MFRNSRVTFSTLPPMPTFAQAGAAAHSDWKFREALEATAALERELAAERARAAADDHVEVLMAEMIESLA